MRVSYNWLKELVSFTWSPQELADRLTMAGVAVDKVYRLGGDLPGIIVGLITSLAPHPTRQNLQVATVTTVADCSRTADVVTGAKNIARGIKVPFAAVGAQLPGGQVIAEVDFNGVLSQGMLCSAEELGLQPSAVDEGGIMHLPLESPVGTEVSKIFGFDDYVLELDLTPNRGDCLSMVGVAREIAALTGNKVRFPQVYTQTSDAIDKPEKQKLAVSVIDPQLCPRYTLRAFTDVKIGSSPLWMQQRLRAAGMRPINNIVDITNYVMLELGQPLHAFDWDLIRGGEIIVRCAQPGEKIITLDGEERSLNEEMLVIADKEGPVGIAGVMGGANSEIETNTGAVLLESACFHNISIRKTAKTLGLRSEASNRFEKGVDPNGTLRAADRVAFLITEQGAADVLPLVIDVNSREIVPRLIKMHPGRVNDLLGVKLSMKEMEKILTALEFSVQKTGSCLTVGIPTFRPDVESEYDLMEEIARIYGYNRIEGTMLQGALTPGERSRGQLLAEKTKDLLAGWGLSEIITYSFYTPQFFDFLRMPADALERHCITIKNPLSEDQSVMRTTLLPSMIATMALNIKHKNTDLALFELSHTYLAELPISDLPQEPLHLIIGLAGRAADFSWNRREEVVDFFALKGLVQTLLEGLGVINITITAGKHPSFHPQRQAIIYTDGEELGVIGELHPDVAAAWGIKERVYVTELDFDLIIKKAEQEIKYQHLLRHPVMVRDMAILVDEKITAEQIQRVIMGVGGELLAETRLFDVYQGDQVPSGKKSLAYSLVYQAADRTLTDKEVSTLHQRILQSLDEKLGAKQRE